MGSNWNANEDEEPPPAGFNFNPDPEWQDYILKYETVIKQCALKYCTADASMRDDVMQEARIALATVFPERIEGYAKYKAGEWTEDQWERQKSKYLRNTIRNSIWSYLNSYRKGNWYIGRTRRVKDRDTGETREVHYPPRYSSLDELVEEFGAQIDETGTISWPKISMEGLGKVEPPDEE